MKLNLHGGASVPASRRGIWRKAARGDARPTELILLFLAAILFFTFSATAQQTNDLSDAEVQGHELAQQLCDAKPTEGFTKSGVIQIRDGNGNHTDYSMTCEAVLTPTNWYSIYTSSAMSPWNERLRIFHVNNFSNVYSYVRSSAVSVISVYSPKFSPLFSPFANSDFWICDLGLEFFHWPEQKILKKENRRSRACNVLESTNPNPSTNGYSRVVSWIDEESGGIVHAQAYDFKNRLLKEFDPKSFKKVNGQWELQEMEIDNVQTGSRTRLEFTGSGATNPPGK